MTSTNHHFEVPPDPSLMEDIGATSFTVAEAIVELVANSLDARPEDGRRLRIDIDVTPGAITVIDDAGGMGLERLKEAVRLGVKMDALENSARKRKGMFGLGMKTASASLGRRWSVVTRPIDGQVEYEVDFDLEEYSRRRGEGHFDWGVDIHERRPPEGGPLGEREHGTAIVVTRLRERDPMAGTVLALLGSAYSPHIAAGDRFFVKGAEALPPAYDFVSGSRQDFELPVDDAGTKMIRGWVALDKRTHNSVDYGFNVYRESQLIEAWNKDWFPPHLMTSRIIGEVHLDFVRVNFSKKGVETQDLDWKLATALMKDFLKPVVRASRDMSRGKNETKYAKAVDGLNVAMGKAPAIGVLTPDDEGDPGTTASGAGATTPRQDILVRSNTLLLADGEVSLSCVVEDFSSDQTPWDYIYDEPTRALQAVLNANSRLFQHVRDEKFLGMLAIADSMTRFLVEEKRFPAARAREIRDRWMYLALSEDSQKAAS
jgi:hypothetical protein